MAFLPPPALPDILRQGTILQKMSDTKTDLAALVAAYQSGAQADPLPIWDAVRYYVKRQAGRFLARSGITCADLEDMMQSGFIALLSALETYQAGEGEFLPWLRNYLITEFMRAANGGRSLRHENEPANRAISIYTETSEDGETILDVLADPADPYTAAEERIYQEQLHAALDAAIDKLPKRQAQTLRSYYFYGQTQAEIAQDQGRAAQAVAASIKQGLQTLRRQSRSNRLRDFAEMNLYAGTGLQRWRRTRTSSTEQAAMRMMYIEDLEARLSAARAHIGQLADELDKSDPGAN